MKFSLILATINRVNEIEHFLKSLDKQTYRNFELLIIDQNKDNRLEPIIGLYKDRFSISHYYSEKGLSKARNVGLKHISGEIVAFPDDDCQYPPNLLENVNQIFAEHPEYDGITGCSKDFFGAPSAGRFNKKEGYVSIRDVWEKAISITIFLRKSCVEIVREFDESLGLGANTPFLSGEETDLLIRILKAGFKIFYSNKTIVFHAEPTKEYTSKAISRAYNYGCGCGHVLKKHNYSNLFKIKFLARPLAGVLLSLAACKLHKANYHFNVLKGRFRGLFQEFY